MRYVVFFTVLVFFTAVVNSQAATLTDLNRVATVFAMRPAHVECRTVDEDPLLWDAWGYTRTTPPWDYFVLRQELCDDLILGSGVPEASFAVLVFTHESFHLRLNTPKHFDEAETECWAIRHWRVSAKLLGLDAVTDYSYARAKHMEQVRKFPEYGKKGCVVPQ